MILACGFILVSSFEIRAEDIEKDAGAALGRAFLSTAGDFFVNDTDIVKVLAGALKKGSVSASMSADERLFGEDVSLDCGAWFDSKNKKYAMGSNVTLDGKDIDSSVMIERGGITLSSKSLFGGENALFVNFSDLSENFADSGLRESVFPENDAEYVYAVEQISRELGRIYEECFEGDRSTLFNDILKLMDQRVATEKLEVEGKQRKCVVVTYTVDNAAIKEIFDMIRSRTTFDDEFKETLRVYVEELLGGLNESADIDLKLTLRIDQKAGRLVGMDLDLEIDKKAEDENDIKVSGTLTFGKEKIVLDAKVGYGKTVLYANAELVKTVNKNKSVYELFAGLSDKKGLEVDLCGGKIEYNRSSGDVSVSFDAYTLGKERLCVTLDGKIDVSRKKVEMRFDSMTQGGESVEFELALTFNKKDELPAPPEAVRNITDVGKDEWEDIFQKVERNIKSE